MAKTKISEWSSTPGSNTDIDSINIAEGCAPSGINDAIREMMAQLKDWQTGTYGDPFNGPVGSTTPAAGSFTTLTTSGTVTHNGGTANGVAYLNGSKVLTTGSALTFDGSSMVLNTSTSSDALRITQTGSGNALVVEDSTNPDSTPFVIDASGTLINGYTSAISGYGGRAVKQQVVEGGGQINAVYSTSVSAPAIYEAARSRSATAGSHTVVQQDDWLGYWVASGSDGTQFIRAAAISAQVDGTPSTNDMPGRLVFSTTADGASSPTERMRIDSNGSVGIGTTSLTNRKFIVGGSATGATSYTMALVAPTVQPDVTTGNFNITSQNATASNSGTPYTISSLYCYNASQGTFNADSTVTNQYGFYASSALTGATNNYGFYGNIASGSNRWNFYAAGTASNYFGGNVGIGTSSPASRLHISYAGAINTNTFNVSTTSSTSTLRTLVGANLVLDDAGTTYSKPATSISGAGILFDAINNLGSHGAIIFLSAPDDNTGSATPTERMRIDSSGNVGIGTSAGITTVASGLAINNATAANYPGLEIQTAGVTRMYFNANNAASYIASVGTSPLVTYTNGSERMRIDSSGRVGIAVAPAGSGPTLRLDKISGSDQLAFFESGVDKWHMYTTTGALGFYDATASTERMRIDSSGNVGIGTSSPSYKLQVQGSGSGVDLGLIDTGSQSTLRVYGFNSTAYSGAGIQSGALLQLKNTSTGSNVYSSINALDASASTIGQISFVSVDDTTNESFMTFSTRPSGGNLTERMRIDSSGNLLIGYTSSNGSYKLQVNSQIFATSSTIATSDGRYKEDVTPLTGALDLVTALNPVQFKWKNHSVHNFDTDTPTVGFIAQEVEQVLADKPYLNSIVKRNECVIEPEEKDSEGNITKDAVTEEFLGIAEGNMIAILTKALQELKAEFDAYKASHP